jgi:hypothetical protein
MSLEADTADALLCAAEYTVQEYEARLARQWEVLADTERNLTSGSAEAAQTVFDSLEFFLSLAKMHLTKIQAQSRL